MTTPILYLHGFASGPLSKKALFFKDLCDRDGRTILIPDLNLPDFHTLTITRTLDTLTQQAALLPSPPVIVGSSLGAYMATLLTAQHRFPVSGLFLMAPAFAFTNLLDRLYKEELLRWRREGEFTIDHPGYGKSLPLAYDFYLDAQRFPPFPETGDTLCRIVQGRLDKVVLPENSLLFTKGNPSREIFLFDDDHGLLNSLEPIGSLFQGFLSLLDKK